MTIPRYRLRSGAMVIALRQEPMVMGRATECEIVLDQMGVSRRHARLTPTDAGVLVEDLRSANGVFVNGRRLTDPGFLEIGDQLGIDRRVFVLEHDDASEEADARGSSTTQRPGDADSSIASASPVASRTAPGESTRSRDAFDLIAPIADALLAAGKFAAAEAALEPVLRNALEAARAGTIETAVRQGAIQSAMKLARSTRKAARVEYVLELCTAPPHLLPMDVVDELYDLLRKLPPIRSRLLREYLAALRAADVTTGPAEKFLLRRLEGLEALTGAL